jgi:NADH-quinone oxidoreductase subunit M
MLFSIGLVYERTNTAFTPRLGGLFDTNISVALLFFIGALSTMVMPGTPGFDAAHLLIEGTIEEYGWLIAVAILVGNVLAAAFLLLAFQWVFMTTSTRAIQPARTDHYMIKMEPVIAITICPCLSHQLQWRPLNISRDPSNERLLSQYKHGGRTCKIQPRSVRKSPLNKFPNTFRLYSDFLSAIAAGITRTCLSKKSRSSWQLLS